MGDLRVPYVCEAATFLSLKTLHLDDIFEECGIDSSKLPWRFPHLERFYYHHTCLKRKYDDQKLTIDFDLPRLKSLNYEISSAKTSRGDLPHLTVKNCPLLEALNLYGISKVTLSCYSRAKASTLKIQPGGWTWIKNEPTRTTKSNWKVVKFAKI
jgi:hypothetical protein